MRMSQLFHAPSLWMYKMARHVPVLAAEARCARPQWLSGWPPGTAWPRAALAGCWRRRLGWPLEGCLRVQCLHIETAVRGLMPHQSLIHFGKRSNGARIHSILLLLQRCPLVVARVLGRGERLVLGQCLQLGCFDKPARGSLKWRAPGKSLVFDHQLDLV